MKFENHTMREILDTVSKMKSDSNPLKTIHFKKLHEDAVAPYRANPGDAGADLTAIALERDVSGVYTYSTGLAIAIPHGHVGLIFPRSSIYRVDLSLTNCVGVIDSGYRGEIKFKFRPTDFTPRVYDVGDRVGQIVIVPIELTEFVEVDELNETKRGSGGFGSSGS